LRATGRERQVSGGDVVRAGEDERALDRVLQLAHVAGERVALERAQRRGRELVGRRAVAPEHVLDQPRHVARPLAQRRQHDREHVQAEEEILAERARLHHVLERPVRGGDDARVHGERSVPAHARERLLLDRLQQLDLERERHLADLVQEQRAAVRVLEPAGLLAHGAGECALLVAEELGLEQRLGQRAAVDLDPRAAGALRERVQRAREQVLARPALAAEQHGAVGGGHLAHQLQRRPRRRGVADHGERVAPQRLHGGGERPVRALQLALLGRVAQHAGDHVDVVALLLDVVLGAQLQRLAGAAEDPRTRSS
jgi:hypothetical protein